MRGHEQYTEKQCYNCGQLCPMSDTFCPFCSAPFAMDGDDDKGKWVSPNLRRGNTNTAIKIGRTARGKVPTSEEAMGVTPPVAPVRRVTSSNDIGRPSSLPPVPSPRSGTVSPRPLSNGPGAGIAAPVSLRPRPPSITPRALDETPVQASSAPTESPRSPRFANHAPRTPGSVRIPTAAAVSSSPTASSPPIGSAPAAAASLSVENIFPSVLPVSTLPAILLALKEHMPVAVAHKSAAALTGPPGSAPQRVLQAGRSWQPMLNTLSFVECLEIINHFLRNLKAPILTTEMCRWFIDTELVQDEMYRFKLFLSLIQCLPRPNRLSLRLIAEVLQFGGQAFSQPIIRLGSAFLGLPATVPSGQVFVECLLWPGSMEVFFMNQEPSRKMEVTETLESIGSEEDPAKIVSAVTSAGFFDLLIDPYYCAVLEPSFSDMACQMYEYVWPSAEVLLPMLTQALRRFLRPEPWAAEVRMRLVTFILGFVKNVNAAVASSLAWKKNWALLMQAVGHHLNVGEDSEVSATLRERARAIQAFSRGPAITAYESVACVCEKKESLMNGMLSMKPVFVANALRRVCMQPFVKLTYGQMIKQRWQKAETSPAFADLVGLFNGIHAWAVGWVLQHDQAKDRAAVLNFLLKCAHHCQKQNNFHVAMALFFAASDPAVSRLNKTWKLVSSKGNGYMNDLKALADPKNNHAVYAAAIKSATPPVIPYMAIVSKYLFSMEDANSDYLDEEKTMLNLTKMRMISSYLSSIFALRENAESILNQQYSFAEVSLASLFGSCVNAAPVDSQASYERSLQVEPREQ